jgi:hypothetical protein
VHLRRALILLALVLGLTALAASLAPPPAQEQASTPPASSAPGTTAEGELRVRFRDPPPHRRPATREVAPGRALDLTVAAKEPGQARIPLLGRVASVTPADPARFNLLTPSDGRYDVHFVPASGGTPRHVGTIAVSSAR